MAALLAESQGDALQATGCLCDCLFWFLSLSSQGHQEFISGLTTMSLFNPTHSQGPASKHHSQIKIPSWFLTTGTKTTRREAAREVGALSGEGFQGGEAGPRLKACA